MPDGCCWRATQRTSRRLAGAVSAIDTAYPSPGDPLTGRRMPDVALVAGGSGATGAIRVYELLHEGRFVLLGLDGDAAAPDVGEWAARVTSVAGARYDAHPALDGLREILIRPDGHVAWATRTPTGEPAGRSAPWRDRRRLGRA